MLIGGTRPEIIKLAPLYWELKKSNFFDIKFVCTGQHQELLQVALRDFKITPDMEYKIMKPNQNLGEASANILSSLNEIISQDKPNYVIVQGDTVSALMGAIAAFYSGAKVIHLEAGLRTSNLRNPFPEEANRRLISQITDMHFAATNTAKTQLEKEGFCQDKIFTTGNTGIDALYIMEENIKNGMVVINESVKELLSLENIVLVTAHRRESQGEPLENICNALRLASERHPKYNFVFPVHPNPNSRLKIQSLLSNISNIHLTRSLSYGEIVAVLGKSSFIITDSGGLQEEAPSLNIRTLIIRDTTERMEAVEEGISEICGTKSESILSAISSTIENLKVDKYHRDIFGDGSASKRITEVMVSKCL